MKKDWRAEVLKHRGVQRIFVFFEYDEDLITRVKKLPGVLWSSTKRAWHLPDTQAYRERFGLLPAKALTQEHEEKLALYRRWLEGKRYSANTIKTYMEVLSLFLVYFCERPVGSLTNGDLSDYNNDYILRNKLSVSYQNQLVNAVKLFFRVVEGTTMDIEMIYRPRREKKLPNVLSKEEVKLILENTRNLKHKAMLSLIYACGLRSGELLKLLPEHVDSKRGVLVIKQAKGNKDRIAPIGQGILDLLRLYYTAFKPKRYLFEGMHVGEMYDARSLQLVLKQSLARTDITKPVTLHWLRHSYATHLLENGTDLRYIQEILGHRSSRTTEIYTNVSTSSIRKIVSPFDML
ncbi:MAG: tyrosine-type recombinase/integrase [Bacteroidota bacterium]